MNLCRRTTRVKNGVGTNLGDSLACPARFRDSQHLDVPLLHCFQDGSEWQTLWTEGGQSEHIPAGNSTIAFSVKQWKCFFAFPWFYWLEIFVNHWVHKEQNERPVRLTDVVPLA